MKRRLTKPSSKPRILHLAVASIGLASTLALTLPSIAEDSTKTDNVVYTGAAPQELARTDSIDNGISLDTKVQKLDAEIQSCGDLANPDGLAAAQQNGYRDRVTMIGAVTNIDKLYNVADKGGCFNALSNFPDLSVAIPSLTSIANALKKTMVDYATRKVCSAVNEALTEALDPINKALDKVSQSGQIDMTGVFNKELSKKLYEVDPELGRVAPAVENGYTWDLKEDFNSSVADPTSGTGGTTASGNYSTPQQSSRATTGSITAMSSGLTQGQQGSEKTENSITESIKSFFQ